MELKAVSITRGLVCQFDVVFDVVFKKGRGHGCLLSFIELGLVPTLRRKTLWEQPCLSCPVCRLTRYGLPLRFSVNSSRQCKRRPSHAAHALSN